ncbi:MAG: hypothetical protein M3457_14520 [Chloroflexota bacterium]|nr:hypothetical protein [Chloroflexota bacterium]
MHRLAGPIIGLVLTLAGTLSIATSQATPASLAEGEPLYYNQITTLEDDSGSVGYPVLSADGTTAVFVEAPGTSDPAIPNRIFVIGSDGSGLTEVDAYQTLCFCGSMVDISADGATVVSTDGVQVRIADAGSARELVSLTSGEITSLVIAGDGETVFFIVRRDTATMDGATPLPRGVWAIDADGRDLRQVVGAEDVADAAGVAAEETGCCFHSDGHPLDASSSGGHVVFGTYAGDGEHVFAIDGDGSNLTVLRESVVYAMRVAISGDGATVAYDVMPQGADVNEVAVVPFTGGEPKVLEGIPNSGWDEPLQLSDDGSQLLVSPNSYLVDTATGAIRQLAVHTPGADNQTPLLVDGMPRATMDAGARRFLYVIRSTRCADCPNMQEQLATLDIGGEPQDDMPTITNAPILPDEIPLNFTAAATASAEVEGSGTQIAVGVVALRDGRYDVNVGRDGILHDDGLEGDVTANDGVFTNNAIVHLAAEARDDDTGLRTARFQAEFETSDGLRHAVAVDAATLTVIAGP